MINKFKKKLGKDANLKELLHGSAVTFVIKVTGMLISYFVILIISRKYGAEGVGLYSLTSRLLNSLAIFGCLGLNISVLRYVGQFAKYSDAATHLKHLYVHLAKMAFPFGVAVGVVLYIFAEELAVGLFENATYVPALKISAFVLPFFTMNLINVEFIRGLKLLRVSEYLRSINKSLVIIVLLALSVFGFGILNPVYALVSGLLFTFVLSLGYILRYFKKNKPGLLIDKGLTAKEIFTTSSPMMMTAVASFMLANAGTFFLEIYTTTDQVGIFMVCISLAQLVSLVLVVVNTISAPKFAELYWAGKMKELKKMVRQSSKIIFYVSLMISVGLIVFSDFILGVFGKEYTVENVVLIILVFGQVVNATAGSSGIFMNMTGNQTLRRNIMIITTVIVLLGYFIIVPIYGIIGAACVAMGGAMILSVSSAWIVYKKLNFITAYIPFITK